MSNPLPPIYRTTNWRACNAALRQRGSLSIWFDPEMQWLAASTGKRGRQPVFADVAIQTCLTLRALVGLPLRQVTGMVASLLALAGLDWSVPDYGTLCRRQKGLVVVIAHRPDGGFAPAHRQSRDQGSRRRRMVRKEARAVEATPVAQGSPWN